MELALISLLLVVIMIMVFLFWRLSQKQRDNQKEKQLLNEELERARNSLLEQERFLAYTSHELRTPLNAIAGGSVLLAKTNLDERQLKYVNTIQSSVDATLLIVNDILDLSKIDSNMVEVRPVEFMITEVLNGIKHILSYRAESKGIEFEVEFVDEIPAVIKGDSKHLNQILLNLSTNAVKFTDIGKVTIRISKVSETDTHLTLKFDVEDTGKGIRKSNLPTIFNQYEQETRHTIKHEGGTGLGLAITQEIIARHLGSVNVESEVGVGSTFIVRLPVKSLPPESKVDVAPSKQTILGPHD